MELRHHPFGQMLDSALKADAGLCEETFRLGAVKSRGYAGDEVQGLRDLYPARQHGNVGDAADISHQQIALFPAIASEDAQLSLIWHTAEHSVQCRRRASTVGRDDPRNLASA